MFDDYVAQIGRIILEQMVLFWMQLQLCSAKTLAFFCQPFYTVFKVLEEYNHVVQVQQQRLLLQLLYHVFHQSFECPWDRDQNKKVGPFNAIACLMLWKADFLQAFKSRSTCQCLLTRLNVLKKYAS